MSRIDELIRELCPAGVKYMAIGAVVERGSKVRWSDVQGEEFQYIDLTSIDRTIHAIVDTATITSDNAPSRAQQLVREGDVLFGATRPMLKRYATISSEYDSQVASTGYCVLRPKSDLILTNFLFHLLGTAAFYAYVEANERGSAYPAIPDRVVKEFRIPVPPVEVQREIVRILDLFTSLEAELEAELDKRRQQDAYYRDSLLAYPEAAEARWALMPEISINRDTQRKPVTKSAREAGDIPYYGASGVVDHVSEFIFDGDYLLVSEDGANLLARSTPIAFSVSGKAWVNNHAHVLEFPSYQERRFVEIYLNSIDLTPFVTGGAQPKLSQANLNKIPIPAPPLADQRRIVAILDHFDALVNDLSIGLPAELNARRKQYEYYRDKLLTFREAAA